MRGLVIMVVVLMAPMASPAATTDELIQQVFGEIYKADRDGYAMPTCENLRRGTAIAQDLDGTEATIRRGLALRVLGREQYYLGLVELARRGADFDVLAAQCWKGLPLRHDERQGNHFARRSDSGLVGPREGDLHNTESQVSSYPIAALCDQRAFPHIQMP